MATCACIAVTRQSQQLASDDGATKLEALSDILEDLPHHLGQISGNAFPKGHASESVTASVMNDQRKELTVIMQLSL